MKDKLSLKKNTENIHIHIHNTYDRYNGIIIKNNNLYNIYNVLALVWWATVQKDHKESDMTEWLSTYIHTHRHSSKFCIMLIYFSLKTILWGLLL